MTHSEYRTLARTENQARLLGEFARDFILGDLASPDASVLRRLSWFHLDSMACGVSALHGRMRAPWVLREEARRYGGVEPSGRLFGDDAPVAVEKAIVANCSAVRELDSNGTNFGDNPRTGDRRGEFGHNDFYPAAIAAAQLAGLDGRRTMLAMLCLDEIRGRLAEVFALRDHKVDHVVHGAIASAAVFAACLGADPAQIESAIGLTVAHYIPFRAIRAGKQLSDSKGASAALSTEAAVVSAMRALHGFLGPRDVFRNPQAIFNLFEPPAQPDSSPFDLHLTVSGDDFAIMRMHFKLGLYEHQSAGALQGLINVLTSHPQILEQPDGLRKIRITIYEPAFSIIGDPAKRDPRTRQSADHSMVFIAASALRKAFEQKQASWEALMLTPEDYSEEALTNPRTRALMELIEFEHGGPDYDRDYPAGIPTSVTLDHEPLGRLASGKVLFPMGHAGCDQPGLEALLDVKLERLVDGAINDLTEFRRRFLDLEAATVDQVRALYDFAFSSLDRPLG